jgi:hypothetical protein
LTFNNSTWCSRWNIICSFFIHNIHSHRHQRWRYWYSDFDHPSQRYRSIVRCLQPDLHHTGKGLGNDSCNSVLRYGWSS